MNHFGFLQGQGSLMKQLRDLPQELNHTDSAMQVGSAIAAFIDVHQDATSHAAKEYIMDRITDTADYLRPIILALNLEGSKHVGGSRTNGSPWLCEMQKEILRDSPIRQEIMVTNEVHASWYLNLFAKVPFFHPKVSVAEVGSVRLETMNDHIYEKTDSVFDGGFFSNTVSELRCKFNSPQAVVQEVTGQKIPFIAPENFAKKLNQKTIDWALKNAPARVLRRYEANGIKLVAGDDIPHSSGPGWIWSYLEYEPRVLENGKSCREVRSHTMVTPADHPIPAAGGKMYAKVLSPAKALDWMYTDGLRTDTNPLKLMMEAKLSQREIKPQPIP